MHHAKTFITHLTIGIRHKKHIRIGKIRFNALPGLHGFTYIPKQRQVQIRQFGEKTGRQTSQCRRREFPLQCPKHSSGFFFIRCHPMYDCKKRRRVLFSDNRHRKLVTVECIEHRCQQTVPCTVVHENTILCHTPHAGSSLNSNVNCPSFCFFRLFDCTNKERTRSG